MNPFFSHSVTHWWVNKMNENQTYQPLIKYIKSSLFIPRDLGLIYLFVPKPLNKNSIMSANLFKSEHRHKLFNKSN